MLFQVRKLNTLAPLLKYLTLWNIMAYQAFLLFWETNMILPYCFSETATGGVLWEKVFLKILQKSQENICVISLQLYQKRDSGRGIFLWILQNFQEDLFSDQIDLPPEKTTLQKPSLIRVKHLVLLKKRVLIIFSINPKLYTLTNFFVTLKV